MSHCRGSRRRASYLFPKHNTFICLLHIKHYALFIVMVSVICNETITFNVEEQEQDLHTNDFKKEQRSGSWKSQVQVRG